MLIRVFSPSQTVPTELMSTLNTSHMITAFILDNHHIALRTILPIRAKLPLLEQLVLSLPAPEPWMLPLATLHADLGPTLTGRYLLASFPLDIVETFGFRAPPQIRIQVNINVPLEFQVLLVDPLGPKSLHILRQELFLTSVHHAWDPDHIAIEDVCFQVVLHAELAELVAAFEAKESACWVLLIANVA